MTQPLDYLSVILGQVEHFKRFPEADRLVIVNAGQIRSFPADSIIFREGEACAGMFVLFSGHVHLGKLGPQGQQSLIAEIDPVIMFNEVPVLDDGPNLTTATAIADCTTWNISYENFQALLGRYPTVGLGLLRVLAKRTRNLMSQYEDLSFRSVVARSAKLLLDLSNNGQHAIDRKHHSNTEMAARISTVPEALSRSLQIFRKNGDIICTRTTITVHQPKTLEKFAQIERALY
ncbi:MAG: Crp/Fnr family transcriptional regulator [Chloroflexi bacterium]|nr:Crp/Fnr family transcriptional regulator [Chloroflexota bacterium]